MQPLSIFISQKIKCFSFICMIMVVVDHSYNLNLRYLQPWTLPGEALTATSFTEYFIANGLTRFLIPMLFCISGYLLAMRDNRPYKETIHKRLRTLGIPFLIWSAAGIAFVYTLEMFPATRTLVASSKVVQISDTRLLIHDYHWYEILVRWLLVPISYQLWFLQVLLVYNLAYPALRWCVLHKTARWIFFTIAVLLWLATFGGVIIDGEGLLFFSLGIWIQKNNFNIEKPSWWLNPLVWGIACIILCAGKTWLAFKGEALMGNAVYSLISFMHKLSVLSGLVAAWYGCNSLVSWCMSRKWFVWISGFTFIIYVAHAPGVAIFIDGMFALLHYSDGYRIISFVLLPAITIATCIVFGALLRRLFPKFYTILTGGRGF